MVTQNARASSPDVVTPEAAATGTDLPGRRVTERAARCVPGLLMLVLGIAGVLAGVVLIVLAAHQSGGTAKALIWLAILIFVASALVLGGLTPVTPGRARVVQLFGKYRGTIREPGLQWVNPFTKRIVVSTRIRNQESAQAKVNDADGNPIEIAAVVVWQVQDTASALYSVDELLDHHSGVEAVIDGAEFKSHVALQRVGDQFDQLLVVVDDQHLPLAAFQLIGGDTVIAHEREELVSGDAAEPAARHAESFELPESKQRIIVCCETLQILAASPVVNTVFMLVPPSLSNWLGIAPSCAHRKPFTSLEYMQTASSSGSSDFTDLADRPNYSHLHSPVNIGIISLSHWCH